MNLGEERLCKWQYNIAGSFVQNLLSLIAMADTRNRALLGLAFPEEVEAYNNFQNTKGYWAKLEEEFNSKRINPGII